MLLSYFDYIFVALRQKAHVRPELSPKFLSTLGPNPARTRARPEKPGLTYYSASASLAFPSKVTSLVNSTFFQNQTYNFDTPIPNVQSCKKTQQSFFLYAKA